MILRGISFDTTRESYIVGILNLTPDSFSDGGRYDRMDRALYRAEEMILQGASILDIGGESTRPQHVPVTIQEEIDRVAPVLQALRARFDVPLSLDSYKSEVIRANRAQIDLVNDIWGLQYDPAMAGLIAQSGLSCCLMHNRAAHDYRDFPTDVLADLRKSLSLAAAAGIPREKIILDGGVGFQKTAQENLAVLRNTAAIAALGAPVMVAVSRKSVIGHVLDRPTEQRLFGTLATTAMAVMQGASFIRVHDVSENAEVLRMCKAILEERAWTN